MRETDNYIFIIRTHNFYRNNFETCKRHGISVKRYFTEELFLTIDRGLCGLRSLFISFTSHTSISGSILKKKNISTLYKSIYRQTRLVIHRRLLRNETFVKRKSLQHDSFFLIRRRNDRKLFPVNRENIKW